MSKMWSLIAQTNSYEIFLKLWEIVCYQIVFIQRQGSMKQRIQAHTKNAEFKLPCEKRPDLFNEVFWRKHLDKDGTTFIRVHSTSCRLRFQHGITHHVQLHESEKLTYEKARDLWRSSVETEWEVSKKPLWETS